ncbi:hypothetical protein CAPTEDRAFT_159961 [Capitella teleta]|uniref:39S ribosomal protein L13, mitochondrial n=1 Tax=Capitella teleta TaxID=283909 RepID=R7UMS6_CAPTE|nr:hypothetical protein CAPTEDRAFT_159961 [Capitella teleta]|eukprot:ELU04557.1 hypothetical protein CAPTEDRAFT_159961 [Capitella teleta]
MATNRVQQWATFARTWWIYDAKWQCPRQSAPVLIKYLQGKHKPIYHPNSDIGDHVVVINTKHIAMEGEYWRTWKFSHHTGYPGGFSQTRAYDAHDADPTMVMKKFVYSSMKGTLFRRLCMQRLHLFPEEELPEDILRNVSSQIQQVMPVPKRLDEFSAEERKAFPQLFEWPKDYIMETGQKKSTEES